MGLRRKISASSRGKELVARLERNDEEIARMVAEKNSLISQGVYSAFQLSLLLLFLEKNEACCAGCQNKKNNHDDKTDIGLLLCLGC